MATSFRVAHLSDLHSRQHLPGTAPVARRRSREGVLERALAEVKRQAVDLLVLTGDLVDVPQFLTEGIPKGVPRLPELEEASWLDLIRQEYEALRRLLDGTGLPYRVVPGNHDHAGIFAGVFYDQGAEFLAGGLRWVSFVDHEQEGNRPRRLIGSRHLFEQVLNDNDPTPQVHLQHYPLKTPPTGSYPYAYAEAAWLRRQIEASGRVRLVLSGHYHAGTPLEQEEGRSGTIYTVGEALGDAPHPWRIYEFEGESFRMERHLLPPVEPSPSPVVFLDRDGVINDLPAYSFGPERMRLIPGAAAAIWRLNEAGVRAVVVTSQSAIGMGYVTPAIVHLVNERMQQLLAAEGATVDAIYYTPGAGDATALPDAENWPTAKSGLIEKAFAELPLRREGAWIVGDRMTDLEAGREAGIAGMLVRTGYGADQQAQAEAEVPEVPVANNLAEAVERILQSR